MRRQASFTHTWSAADRSLLSVRSPNHLFPFGKHGNTFLHSDTLASENA